MNNKKSQIIPISLSVSSLSKYMWAELHLPSQSLNLRNNKYFKLKGYSQAVSLNHACLSQPKNSSFANCITAGLLNSKPLMIRPSLHTKKPCQIFKATTPAKWGSKNENSRQKKVKIQKTRPRTEPLTAYLPSFSNPENRRKAAAAAEKLAGFDTLDIKHSQERKCV